MMTPRLAAAIVAALPPPPAPSIASALATINVKNHIPFPLELDPPNYSTWRELFQTLVGKFGASFHIDGTPAPENPDATWLAVDCSIRSLIYSSASPRVMRLIMENGASAHTIWTKAANLFLDNKASRAMTLEAKFRALTQGDLPVLEFAQRLKDLADGLADLEQPVNDSTLLLALLHGVNEPLRGMASILKTKTPLPSFLEAQSLLALEESELPVSTSTTAFTAPRGASAPPRAPPPMAALAAAPAAPAPSSSRPPSRPWGRGRGKGRGNNSWRPPRPWSNPWSGSFQMWPMPGQGILGAHPGAGSFQAPRPPLSAAPLGAAQAHLAAPLGAAASPPSYLYSAYPSYGLGSTLDPSASWNQAALANVFNTMTLQQPDANWYMDSGASSHLSSSSGNLSNISPSLHSNSNILVGNGTRLPITCSGYTLLPNSHRPFHLSNVLVSPQLIANLISVRKFTTDNSCSVEFDPFGLSVKDLQTKTVLHRCDSSGDLYPLLPTSTSHPRVLLAALETIWHRRLGHPGNQVLSRLRINNSISVIPSEHDTSLCHACQLGRHTRLPFPTSMSRASKPFELIHCDLWTSPVISISGSKYYLVCLDDFTHYLWTFPLKLKSETFNTLRNFHSYVLTHFHCRVQFIQSDNGREFDNNAARSFFLQQGIHLRLSCPHTSQQNGKAERVIRSINNIMRTLLFQASMPPAYWAESLRTATYLFNLHPTKTLQNRTPHQALFGTPPSYAHLRVFGCRCYPNLSATMPHKLAPRSTECVLLGFPDNHKGYRCLDLTTNRVITSRHVVFDEQQFPFTHDSPAPLSAYDFLDDTDVDPVISGGFPAVPSNSAGPPMASPGAGPVVPSAAQPAAVPPHHQGTTSSQPRQGQGSGAAPLPLVFQGQALAPDSPVNDLGHQSGTSAGGLHYRPPVTQVYTRRQEPPGAPPVPADQPPLVPSPALPSTTSTVIPAAMRSSNAPIVPVPPTINQHAMQTRGKSGISQPRQQDGQAYCNLAAASKDISLLPKTYRGALSDPNWKRAMEEEYGALIANQTWDLVPPPPHANIVSGKWLYRHKLNADGSLARYKARWVVRGFSQQHGLDYDETFSPVVKPATIRTVLSLAVSSDWPIHQLDVKNAFLHGTLNETVYCQQPPGFVDPSRPNYVCKLNKALYGLKQAPRAWYSRFQAFITSIGFQASQCDTSLFIYTHGTDMAYLLLYVDDIILTASSHHLLQHIIGSLQQEFAMTDLGNLHYFLGVSAERSPTGLFLSQAKYAAEILVKANMSSCNPCQTPLEVHSKLSSQDGPPVADPTLYRSLAGALQYLTLTRPDIAHAVQQVCLYMHDPRESHFALIKRILRYIKGTMDYGLALSRSRSHELVVYSDADWAGCPDTRRSTSGYCVFLGDNLISWSSKRQHTVSRSSAEAEYRGVANAVAETCWIRQLLSELRRPLTRATLVYCDNISAVYLSTNPVHHQRTKHVEIDLHFVRERVALGAVRVLHVPTSLQYADIFTKGLPTAVFINFRSSLNIRSSPG